MKVQHIAAVPAGGVQKCSRCGQTITDNRGAMVEIGSGPPAFWEPGPVFNMGNCWTVSVLKPSEFQNCVKEGNA